MDPSIPLPTQVPTAGKTRPAMKAPTTPVTTLPANPNPDHHDQASTVSIVLAQSIVVLIEYATPETGILSPETRQTVPTVFTETRSDYSPVQQLLV